jgi:hypothetical protein
MWWSRKVKHVKTVHAFTTNRETGDVNAWAAINLYQQDGTGKRSYHVFGDWSVSPRALMVKAEVDAWIHGGPMPEGQDWILDAPPPPKPRKSLPSKKKKQEFPGVTENVVEFPAKKVS